MALTADGKLTTLQIDILDVEISELGYPQARTKKHTQDGVITPANRGLDIGHRTKEPLDLFFGQKTNLPAMLTRASISSFHIICLRWTIISSILIH